MKLSFVLATALCAVSASAVAQGPGMQGPGGGPRGPQRLLLRAIDTDGDGQISAAEIAAASTSLAKLDKNGDGIIMPEEINPRMGDRKAVDASVDETVKRMFLLDRNNDGVLTKDEMPERMQALFTRGDANHDGKLTADEIRAMSQNGADPQGARAAKGSLTPAQRLDPVADVIDADSDGAYSAAEIAAAPEALKTLDKNGDGILQADEIRMRPQTAEMRADHLLDEWDSDRDGVLTKEEAPERMGSQFAAIDADGDGKLTRAELTVYFGRMPVGGPGGAPPQNAPGMQQAPSTPNR